MTQQEQQQFAESLEVALSWIQDVQERVNANDSTQGPLDALKVRLDETKKIYQSKHEGQMKMADAQTAAQILLESEDEELHKRTNAKLKELKSMWDETEQSITHCHSRIEWVWLRWREYLKIYEEFELWLEKQRCYLDVDVEQQVGAKEKLWQVDQQRVVLSDVRAKVAVLERLLEEAATLYSTTQDPSVDSQTQERLQESYHDIKSRSEERLALLQRISDEHYQYQDYVDKFQAFLLSKTKELNQLMPPEEPTDGKVETLKALDYSVACEEKTLKYIEVIADGIKANTSPAGAEVVQEEAEELRLGWQRLRQELFEAGEAFGCSLDSHSLDSPNLDSPNLVRDNLVPNELNSNSQDSSNLVVYRLDSPNLVPDKLNSNSRDSANPVLFKFDSQSLDSPNPDSLDPIPYKADSHSQDSPNLLLNKLNSNIQDSANPVPYKLDSQSLDSPNPDSLDPIPYKADSHSQDSPKLVLNKLNSNIQDSANPVLYKLDSQSQDSSNLVPHEVDSPNPDLHSMKSQNDYNDRNQQLELDILRLKVLLHDLETKLNNPPFYSHNYEDQMLGRWRTFEDTRKQLEEHESHVENLKAQYDDLLKRSANSHFLSEEMVAVDTELQRMKSRATELCFKSQTRVEELLQESLQEYANWSLRASKALEKSAGVNDSSLIEDPIIEINVLLNERYDLNNRLSALEQTGDQFESIFEPEKANDMLVKLRDAIQQQELLDNQMVQEKERMRGLILGTKDFDIGYKKVEAKIASFRERLEEADTPQTDVFAIQKQSKDIRALMKDLEDFWDHFLALDLLVSTSEENRNLYDGLVESWHVLQGEAEAKRYEKSIAMSNHKDFLKVKMGKEYYEEMIKKTEARNRSLQRSKLVNRVCRVALPLWLLFTFLLLACFLLPFVDESNSCSLTNNFARSFNVMLRYHGPPPT
ncbi:Nesprin-3 [Oryzias melastigma]|uniref:Nesprin-3 n=1 Tax=Oryzias melastigma TaxID=30732 RepID=A0A834CUM3_ORYME|nr:Nesprin-3 [Oryzias melastigma]